MIDNVRSAMARMEAIRSTIEARAATTTAPATGGMASPQVAQAMFGSLLDQARYDQGAYSQVHPTSWPALTPVAGPVQTGAPPGLEGFSNGQIPEQLLSPIPGTGERLWGPAAAAFDHMRRDAAQLGIELPIVDAYRTYEDQVRLAHELGLYREGGLAAEPGTSQHGWGRALDLDVDDRAVAWLRENAWKYGFKETVPREPWHWEFHPA